jgi:hypothetical protein
MRAIHYDAAVAGERNSRAHLHEGDVQVFCLRDVVCSREVGGSVFNHAYLRLQVAYGISPAGSRPREPYEALRHSSVWSSTAGWVEVMLSAGSATGPD